MSTDVAPIVASATTLGHAQVTRSLQPKRRPLFIHFGLQVNWVGNFWLHKNRSGDENHPCFLCGYTTGVVSCSFRSLGFAAPGGENFAVNWSV